MPGFPYDVTVEIAFTGNYGSPTWTDVTDDVEGFSTSRGRGSEFDVCDPGELSLILDNSSGDYTYGNSSGPYYGNIRHNRMVRVAAQQTALTPVVYLFTGYIDSWTRTTTGDEYGQVEVRATDLFKLLAKRTVTGACPQSSASARIRDILDLMAFSFVDQVNLPAYSSLTVVGKTYDRENALQAMQEAAEAEGGALYVSGAGALVYQSNGFRTTDTRATTSNGTFGNGSTDVPIEPLAETIDDMRAANTVYIRDATGTEIGPIAHAGAILLDGILELDLGETQLIDTAADTRANEVLLRRYFPQPRYESLVLDCLTSDDAMAQALNREIGDRVTVSLASPGSGTTSHDQLVQGVEHNVSFVGQSWTATLAIDTA